MRVSDELRGGTELAGYRIASLLGRGGMGMVYLAEDRRLRRPVALKLLAAGLAEDRSFREGLLRESELAASIDHPNIVPIYEAGEADGLLFIAMRYVEGRDLRERLQGGPLDLAEAIGIVAQVASALDAAHVRGLVHRDVKPSNVLLDRGARPDGSDHVYLADFGLTQRMTEAAGPGEGDLLLGSVDYVAPEQIEGREVDGRADVYSLGCVLFECLVASRPSVANRPPRSCSHTSRRRRRHRANAAPRCRRPWTPSSPRPWRRSRTSASRAAVSSSRPPSPWPRTVAAQEQWHVDDRETRRVCQATRGEEYYPQRETEHSCHD